MPVLGMVLVTTATFSTACRATCTTNPTTSSAPNRSGAWAAMVMPRQSSSTNSPTTAQAPHEAQFLADDGEDEVVLRLGDEKMLLAAFPQTEAGGPAGADGIEALDGLVAVAQRVGKGVEPGAEPVGGVGDEVGHDGHRRTNWPRRLPRPPAKPPQTCAAHEHQHRADAEDEDGAGQVRLQQHQAATPPAPAQRAGHPR